MCDSHRERDLSFVRILRLTAELIVTRTEAVLAFVGYLFTRPSPPRVVPLFLLLPSTHQAVYSLSVKIEKLENSVAGH